MKGSFLMQGALLVLSWCWSCHAMARWPGTGAVPPRDSNRRYNPSKTRPLLQGLVSPREGPAFFHGRTRPVATAVASSGSHLATGRTASGVLENCIEACVNTLGSFVGGTITGCVIGAFMGGTFGRVPDVGLLKSVQTKAGQMGGDWGKLTAAFTGFTSVSTVVRGRKDKWDQVVGACGAGAFLNRAKGPSGMAQGAATYGLFSLVFAVQSKEDELDVVDVPVDAPTKRR